LECFYCLSVEAFFKESATQGCIALPIIENASRKMRDRAGETPALPFE
jgi:hypothetical protein